jgi:CHAD domain-containing protein
VLERYGRTQLDAIAANEAGARRADQDAIHDLRVAVRRLRATLRTFRAVLDRERVERLRAELRWLGRLLGSVRDGQVMTDRLAESVAAEPPELVLGPVAARIHGDLVGDTAEAHRCLVEAFDGPRYGALLADLDHFTRTGLARKHPPRRLRKLARKALRRADRRLASADMRPARLHAARRAYKRARYAAEALIPLAGKPARRLAKRLSALQDVLGAHQDATVTSTRLRDFGVRAHLDGDNAFTYGRLHAHHEHAGERHLAALDRAVKRANRRSVRRWLRR